ncbi:hypothetical protein [Polymorphospora rubra]|uniref:hypothetical protein n=1 Tax=Polymorphospora rubra TaxID=338584 RepID=UPI003401E144
MAARLRHLRVPLIVSALLLVVAVLLGWLVEGADGAAGAAAGVAVVTFSYLLSSVAVAWADSVLPKLVLTVGLATYVLKFSIFGVVMFAVAASGWAGLRTMAAAMICATVAWVTAQVWWTFKAKIPYVEIPSK